MCRFWAVFACLMSKSCQKHSTKWIRGNDITAEMHNKDKKGDILLNNTILEFLEAYKSLDDLCKQIMSSDKGISKYIDEMNHESYGHMRVDYWEKDYKQLKKMRYIRNKLVHEVNSFQENIINIKDIEWLENFRTRIMECTDPFSLLYQSKNTERKINKQEEYLENHFKRNESSCNWKLDAKPIILLVIIILAFIFFATSIL